MLPSLAMLPEPSASIEDGAQRSALSEATAQRYDESGAAKYGINLEHFEQIVAAVVARYANDAGEPEKLALVATLRVEELVLARACTAGIEAAWDAFLTRFRAPLYEAAYRIARNEATGRELADGLYAELYGMPNREGKRVAKLDYYMGRGSLEGWLRTVLAQQHVNRFRAKAKDVSLDEQVEAGASFAAAEPESAIEGDDVVGRAVAQTLAEVSAEERFLLASYYLDQRTLADIARQLGVHESTISRKMDRLTGTLRKRIRKRMQAAGMQARRCDELLEQLDVRDLNIDVAANLGQEKPTGTF
ncbi:MAG TPA: sigma-70 family RNA polymerase sigma factor [Terracidiphilus sp.]|nr:sigma-70 family RNA polymerase sigma factor [Terracidiphilus sp.]